MFVYGYRWTESTLLSLVLAWYPGGSGPANGIRRDAMIPDRSQSRDRTVRCAAALRHCGKPRRGGGPSTA
eukprot:722092-Hanusia_phi.AAC.1